MWYFAIAFHLFVGPLRSGTSQACWHGFRRFAHGLPQSHRNECRTFPLFWHPFLWAEAHYRGRAIAGQLHSAIGSTRGFPSSISFNEDKTPDVIAIVGQVQAAGRSDRNEAPWQTTKSGNQSRSEEG